MIHAQIILHISKKAIPWLLLCLKTIEFLKFRAIHSKMSKAIRSIRAIGQIFFRLILMSLRDTLTGDLVICLHLLRRIIMSSRCIRRGSSNSISCTSSSSSTNCSASSSSIISNSRINYISSNRSKSSSSRYISRYGSKDYSMWARSSSI